jgi:hypothetical protein
MNQRPSKTHRRTRSSNDLDEQFTTSALKFIHSPDKTIKTVFTYDEYSTVGPEIHKIIKTSGKSLKQKQVVVESLETQYHP